MPTGGFRVLAAMTLLLLLAACQNREGQLPSRENFTTAVTDYLAQRGNLCVGKYDWPIAVTDADRRARTLDAQQLPVMEALGLATGRDLHVVRKTADGASAAMPAREYALTPEGRTHYLHVPVVVATATEHVTHPGDFCVAKLALDRVFGWESPQRLDGRTVSSVLFSYRITDPAPWMGTQEARLAFPMAVRAIENAGALQVRVGVHLGPTGWIADELSD